MNDGIQSINVTAKASMWQFQWGKFNTNSAQLNWAQHSTQLRKVTHQIIQFHFVQVKNKKGNAINKYKEQKKIKIKVTDFAKHKIRICHFDFTANWWWTQN